MTVNVSLDDVVVIRAERASLQQDWNRQRCSASAVAARFAAGYDTMLLADEVGMGKTYVALTVVAHHVMQSVGNDRKVLLVVPPSPVLKVKWEQEIRSFNGKYLTPSAQQKGLRPVAVDSYWDLMRNLHDYDDRHDVLRVDAVERNCFIYCLFEWARGRGRLGKRRSLWSMIEFFDKHGPQYFQFCSDYSIHALWRFLDKEYEARRHWFDELFRELAGGTVVAWKIANLLKDFARRQDGFEPNVFIMGMNALSRPKIHQHENKLLTAYIAGLLLAGRWEETRLFYLQGLEKANVLPEKGTERWNTYAEAMLSLSRSDFFGLRNAARAVASSADIRQRWDALADDIRSGNAAAIQCFAADLADRVFQAKIAEAGIGLAVIDEIHNWKNGNLGAQAFCKNYAPFIPLKLVMSATPFQIAEAEMRTLFGYVCHPEGRTAAAIDTMFAAAGPVARCLDGSQRFAKAWKALSREPAALSRFREVFDGVRRQDVPAIAARLRADPACPDELVAFATALDTYCATVGQLESQLREVMIRHTKSRGKRDFQAGRDFGRGPTGMRALYPTPGYASEGDALANFIGIRLDQLIRRELKGSYEANARLLGGITSSTAAFRESAGYQKWKDAGNGSAGDYYRLFDRILDARPHPKVAATVEHAFRNFTMGRKTLIFCERTATLNEVVDQLNERIGQHLARQSSDEALKRDTLLKNTGFVDNLWWLSLGLATGHPAEWDALHARNLSPAVRYANGLFLASGVAASPRRIIRLLDLFLIAHAWVDGFLTKSRWESAGHLYHLLYTRIAEEIASGNFDHLHAYLNAGSTRAASRIEEHAEEDAVAGIEEVVQKQYIDRQNLWQVEQGSFHRILWDLIGSEAAALDASIAGPDGDRALAFIDILTDLMEGLRKVVLRNDLIGRYEATGSSRTRLERIREGFAHMEIGHGETMCHRVERFLAALYEHNGSISLAAMENSKRKNLWQGVFLRDVQYAETLSGNTDPARRVTLCAAFNSPLLPDILVCSAIGSEGIDLHRHCADIIHHDLPWNPAKLEQRIGRVDRVNSLADTAAELKIQVGIPFLEHNYEKFQYDVVFSRAQKFEVLMGKPDYRADAIEEEDFDSPEITVIEGRDAEAGVVGEILIALPDAVVAALAVDLSTGQHETGGGRP